MATKPTPEAFARMLQRMNNFLNVSVKDRKTGEPRKCHIKKLGNLPHREGQDPGYTIVKLEIEELLFQPIIENKGKVAFGFEQGYKLQGGGLAEAIRAAEKAAKTGAKPDNVVAAGLQAGLRADRETEAEHSDNPPNTA